MATTLTPVLRLVSPVMLTVAAELVGLAITVTLEVPKAASYVPLPSRFPSKTEPLILTEERDASVEGAATTTLTW